MKRFFAVLLQFFLFLLVFGAGSFVYHPFHLETTLGDGRSRSFVWDGVVLMLLVYVVVVLIEVVRKRLRFSGPWTTLALLLAALAGWAMKFGFVTHNW